MKKLFLLLVVCVFFCSCQNEYDILYYQEGNIEASCTVNDKYDVSISKSNGILRLEVCAPDTLRGVLFEMRGEKVYAIKDEMEILISNDSLKGICALLNCFSLNESAITTVSTINVISFDTDYGLYTVTYGENNLPQHIEITGDTYAYSIDVHTIAIHP